VGAERVVGAAGHDQLGELGREEALQPPEPLELSDLILDAALEGLVPLGELADWPRPSEPDPGSDRTRARARAG
jgi:hypothetical protein